MIDPDDRRAAMNKELRQWCEARQIPLEGSAEEILAERRSQMSEQDCAYLEDFCARGELADEPHAASGACLRHVSDKDLLSYLSQMFQQDWVGTLSAPARKAVTNRLRSIIYGIEGVLGRCPCVPGDDLVLAKHQGVSARYIDDKWILALIIDALDNRFDGHLAPEARKVIAARLRNMWRNIGQLEGRRPAVDGDLVTLPRQPVLVQNPGARGYMYAYLVGDFVIHDPTISEDCSGPVDPMEAYGLTPEEVTALQEANARLDAEREEKHQCER